VRVCKWFLLVTLSVFMLPGFGQERELISQAVGPYRLQIYPIDGRFSITLSNQEEALVLADSGIPYGSFFRILDQNRPIDFSQMVSSIRQDQSFEGIGLEYRFRDGSQFYIWFELVARNELRLSYRFVNGADQSRFVQVLFDTVLGEIGGNHFFINEIPVTREFGFTLQEGSPQASPIVSGVFQQPSFIIKPELPSGATQLVQIALGNTRRLTETFGFFTVNSNRNFNLLPFSVNDSAILSTQSIEINQTGSMIFRLQYAIQPEFSGIARLPNFNGQQAILVHTAIEPVNQNLHEQSRDQDEKLIDGLFTESAIQREFLQERLTTVDQLNRILLQIDQALSNPNQHLDTEFLEAELERIRRSSGL
jgi:hypothetical protein